MLTRDSIETFLKDNRLKICIDILFSCVLFFKDSSEVSEVFRAVFIIDSDP